MTQRSDIETTLAAYFSGMNAENYDQVAALFTPDARLKAPGCDWVQGVEAVEGYYRAALGPYPEHRDEATRTIIADSVATVEIHFSGALASGVPLEFDAVDVFDFDDAGKITHLTSWYDSHAVRSELRAARAAAEAQAP
jgi:ketosteroid isomerase-like protein